MAATAVDQAFEDLYASYGREVYRYVLALLRNPAEAEDVTQTTFLNAYRALRAGQQPRRPHNWLIAIAHNACRSRVRFAMRRPTEVPLDDVMDQLAVPEAERPNIRELLRTMKRLPVNQCAAITMRELEGRSYVDIAATLGVTVPAAEALIGRARRSLREQAARFRALALVPSAVRKVAALLAVGAIGAGVGIGTGRGSQPPAAPVEHATVPRAQQPLVVNKAAPARARTAGTGRRGKTVATVAVPTAEHLARIETDEAAASASPASTVVETTAAASTVATLTQAPMTVVSQLPTVTTPAVTTPVATVPPVTAPTVTVPPITVPPLP